MRRAIAALLALCLVLGMATAAGGEEINWTAEKRARLKVGNPTALKGCFFTTMWGGTTSDLDVQDLLHAYSPVRYDIDGSQFFFDTSVVQDAVILNDNEGNRTYLLVLYDDLKWSNGTRITAYDYAFSILLCMDPVIGETGGTPMDYSWICGADEYLNRNAGTLSGLRVIDDRILQISVKAEALSYFYELSRLIIHPYPIFEIAPELSVLDDGKGAYLSGPLTAETIRETVLDEKAGYLSHPSVVSGSYTLASYDGTTAVFQINPYFKGTYEGVVPRIGELEYTLADNENMVEKLKSGEFDLLNKVTLGKTIMEGIQALISDQGMLAMENEPRAGLTLIWFMETSQKIQENAVRQAIACCFDRDAFVKDYAGPYGIRTDGLYGLGQWPYRLAAGLTARPGQANDEAAAVMVMEMGTEEYQAGEEPVEEVLTPEPMPEADRAAAEAEAREWENITLDGLTTYRLNTRAAVRLLEMTGWTLNRNGEEFDPAKDTVRYKKTGDELTGLVLRMAMPESEEAWMALETHFTAHLQKAGIRLEIDRLPMEKLEEIYRDKSQDAYDLLYLGENFSIFLDPEMLAPRTDADSELHSVKEELYALALDMVHTEPANLIVFMRKWVKLQERITETLPLIPVYTNVYFDFFTRALHDYRIDQTVTWSEAIVKSYMSDIEELREEEMAARQQELDELSQQAENSMNQ